MVLSPVEYCMIRSHSSRCGRNHRQTGRTCSEVQFLGQACGDYVVVESTWLMCVGDNRQHACTIVAEIVLPHRTGRSQFSVRLNEAADSCVSKFHRLKKISFPRTPRMSQPSTYSVSCARTTKISSMHLPWARWRGHHLDQYTRLSFIGRLREPNR